MYSSVLLPTPEGPMIAAASPRFMESDTPPSTVSGPRGVAYSLVTSEISSMDARVGDVAVDFDCPRRHLSDAVVLTDSQRSAPPQLREPSAVFPQTVNPTCQAARIVQL